jgi:hypothetical protein
MAQRNAHRYKKVTPVVDKGKVEMAALSYFLPNIRR